MSCLTAFSLQIYNPGRFGDGPALAEAHPNFAEVFSAFAGVFPNHAEVLPADAGVFPNHAEVHSSHAEVYPNHAALHSGIPGIIARLPVPVSNMHGVYPATGGTFTEEKC